MLTLLARGAAVLGLASAAWSQTCPVTFDINSISNLSTFPTGDQSTETAPDEEDLPQLGGYYYFVGYHHTTGRELYRTDGMSGTAELVFDATPGSTNSEIELIKVANGKIWFFVNSDYENSGLCVTDGTPAGTQRMKTFFDDVIELIEFNGQIYYTLDTSTTGAELWVTDGTIAGTHAVVSGDGALMPDSIQQMMVDPTGSYILMRGSGPGTGGELWTFDGTNAQLLELMPGLPSSTPNNLKALGNEVLFAANDGVHGYELWKTDGTPAGTQLVLDIDPAGHSTPLPAEGAVLGGLLYFPVQGDGVAEELWVTDGTTAGTLPVADIDPAGQAWPVSFVEFMGEVYFVANVEGVSGYELWKTDGTAAGTQLVHEVWPGPEDGIYWKGTSMKAVGNWLIFNGTDPVLGLEPFRTNGTTTTLLKDINAGSGNSGVSLMTDLGNGQLLMSAQDNLTGTNFWVTDGTAAGTQFSFQLDTELTAPSNPADMHGVNGKFFLFTANNGFNGEELYRWDRAGGVQLVKDINPGPGSSGCFDFLNVMVNGSWRTLFGANDGVNGQELWITDGTPAGTQLLYDVNPNLGASGFGGQLMEHAGHGRIYFLGDDGAHGYELWATDGTAAGTAMFMDIEPAIDGASEPYSSLPKGMTALGDKLVFSAWTIMYERELWVSDGTQAGTVLLYDLWDGSLEGSDPEGFQVLGDQVGFYASYPTYGRELFVTDGTFAGTTLVRDLAPGTLSSGPWKEIERYEYDGYIYFAASAFGGRELWRTDYTWAGTTFLGELAPGLKDGLPRSFVTGGDGELYFVGNVVTDDWRLFWTDGTPSGHYEFPGTVEPQSSFETITLLPSSDGVIFVGRDTNGLSVYKASIASGVMTEVCHLTSKTGGGEVILCDGDFFAVAEDEDLGYEIFQVDKPGAYVQALDGANDTLRLTATAPVLGSTVTIEGSGQPLPGFGLLYYSSFNGTLFPYPTTPGSAIWLSPFGIKLVSVVTGASWTRSVPVPNDPNLIGAQLALQTLYFPNSSFPMTVSNGLQVVVGN